MNGSFWLVIASEESCQNLAMLAEILHHGVKRSRRFAQDVTEELDNLLATLSENLLTNVNIPRTLLRPGGQG